MFWWGSNFQERAGLCNNPALMDEVGGKPTQEISSSNRISGRLGSRLLFSGNYLFHKVPKQKVSLSKMVLSHRPLPPVVLEPSWTQCHHVCISLGEKGVVSVILICLQSTEPLISCGNGKTGIDSVRDKAGTSFHLMTPISFLTDCLLGQGACSEGWNGAVSIAWKEAWRHWEGAPEFT